MDNSSRRAPRRPSSGLHGKRGRAASSARSFLIRSDSPGGTAWNSQTGRNQMHIWNAVLASVAAVLLSAGPTLAQNKSTLETIKERGVIRAGVAKSVPNFGFIDETGNHVGFDYDIVT